MTKHLPSILVHFALFFGAALALTCTEPESIECLDSAGNPSGRVCPVGTVCAAAQDVCIANGCGDSVEDTGEVCDDGNVRDGDGCSADCESLEECGNDIVDSAAGEVCDDNNTVDGDGCSGDCLSSELCGNTITDTAAGEVCDDGNTDSEDGCRNDCISDETCGNGETDTAVGEACDDGNTLDGDACASDCSAGEGCGNDFINVGEICDDGNQEDDDGCSANCLSDETCGNDIIDFAAGEVCDGGNDDSGDGCRSDCKSDETCGNDELDADPGVDPVPEQCDDGGTVDGNGCSSLCQLEVCGNDVLDSEFGETCDDGNTSDGPCVDDPTNPACDDDCSVTACPTGFFCSDITGLCNGLDTCSSDCLSGNGCGNGTRDATEECDDGDVDYEDDCIVGVLGEPVRCEIARCGDGFVDEEGSSTEDCDGEGVGSVAGDVGQTAACDIDCTVPECGDGVTNNEFDTDPGIPEVFEQCDDDGQSAFCDDDCTIAVCGDGVFNDDTTEECDTGGNSATCNADCTLGGTTAPICGDGFTNSFIGEDCDDGGTAPGDGCSADCDFEPFTLGVVRVGTGAGSVASVVAGISCGTDCSERYESAASVTLNATAGTDSYFVGWTGPCSGTGSCVVSMDASKGVGAVFDLNRLTVVKAGTGTGSVSDGGVISCGATCLDDYNAGTVVTLTATPVANSDFTGWAGTGPGFSCPATGPGVSTCVVTMSQARSVTATFTIKQVLLTVAKIGNAASTSSITSVPGTIDCGATCSQNFPRDSSVVLTAVPAANASFTGWSGTDVTCPTLGTCTVTMDVVKTVTANFVLDTHVLSIAKTGTGTGTVVGVSTPSQPDLNCGATCSLGYTAGTSVILTATPTVSASTFGGFSGGGCSTSPCTVPMNVAQNVTATFTVITRTLTATKVGNGTVTSSPTGITCGGTCSFGFPHGTAIGLFAVPDPGWTFTGWTFTTGMGSCATTGGCFDTIDENTTIRANFTQNSYALNVIKTGTGTGTVVANSGAINCGGVCTDNYLSNVIVQLTATPTTDTSTFAGFSGAGCTTSPCNVTMDAAKTVQATFTIIPRNVAVVFAGQGTVVSSPTGISCTQATVGCNADFGHGTSVSLTATPASGFTFSSWTINSGTGACGTTGPCVLSMIDAKNVTATFTALFDLTVLKGGTGGGTVAGVSNPVQTNISCGSSCVRTYTSGTSVQLTATPDANSTLTSWTVVPGPGGADCSGTSGICTVTIGAAQTVTANFGPVNRNLAVVFAGTGTVVSTPAGINSCTSNCNAEFAHGTSVSLAATAGSGFVFSGWSVSSGTCPLLGTCVVPMTLAKTVTATFTAVFDLTVNKNGAGTGTVTSTSSPSQTNLNCGPSCTRTFTTGTSVTLTAAPTDANHTFTGWVVTPGPGGAGCSGTGTCVVAMNAAQTVTATFGLVDRLLTVNKVNGTGGTVTSVLAGINCGPTCSANFPHGTSVTLYASPASGFAFTGWTSGPCTGTAPCSHTLIAPTTVEATFTRIPYNLQVIATGNGNGTVTSTSSPTQGTQINCGSTCTVSYPSATVVTLTAAPTGANSTFTGWTGSSGTGCGGTGTCQVTMDQARTVTANFQLGTRLLTVNKAGTGAALGSVTSVPSGVTCGATTCTGSFDHGTGVTLTAVANASYTFTGWSGEGCSGTGDCNVNMNQARTVSATFVLETSSPTATITSPASDPTFTTAATVNLSGTASDNVAVTSVTCVNSLGGSCIVSGTTSWTVTNAALTAGNNVFTITAQDLAGNTGTDTITVTRDNTDPTVVIDNPANPTFTTATSIAIDGTATDNVGVTSVTWSNSLGGSGLADFTTPPAWSDSVPLFVGANVITVTSNDAAGNTGTATVTVTRDNTAPTVTINQAGGQLDPTAVQPINFTVVFSETVTGFDGTDVSLSGTATVGAATKTITGGPTSYNVAVAGVTGTGTVIATVGAGGATDAAGNTNAASTFTDNTVTLE